MLTVIYHTTGKKIDISSFVSNLSISQDVSVVCDKCTIELIKPLSQDNIKTPDVSLKSSLVQVLYDNKEIFRGYIETSTIDADSQTQKIDCNDMLVFLKKNDTLGNVKQDGDGGVNQVFNNTPEWIANYLLTQFNFPVGSLAQTGVTVKKIANGISIYQAIIDCYKKASVTTKGIYLPVAREGRISVIEKGKQKLNFKLTGDRLISISATESNSNMVNRVRVYSDKWDLITTVDNSQDIKDYGLMQSVISIQSGENATSAANKQLKKLERTINVKTHGNPLLNTGNAVDVDFSQYGIVGTVYIQSAVHNFSNTLYTTDLTLSYENEMDGDADSE